MPAPRKLILVAPAFLENTLRYVRAFLGLPEVQLGLISLHEAARLPAELRERLAAHYRVDDCEDAGQLTAAARAIGGALGGLDGIHAVLEQLQLPVAEVRDALGIPGMSAATARGFRDKARMKELMRAAGVPCARSVVAASAADAEAFVRTVGFPVVAKPRAGVGSRGTVTLRDPKGLESALTLSPPTAADTWQLEEFVTGEERTCETWTVRGEPLWSTGTFYTPRPLEVVENPWVQYTVLLPREDDEEFTRFQPANVATLRALGMDTGLSHMEWFRTPGGRSIVSEVAARPPGVMIMPMLSRACETDMVAVWARMMALEEFTPPTRRYACGTAFFRGQGQGTRVVGLRGFAEAHAAVGALVVDRSLPQLGQPRAPGYEGEGWAMVRHPDTNVVREALKTLVSLVRVDLG